MWEKPKHKHRIMATMTEERKREREMASSIVRVMTVPREGERRVSVNKDGAQG